LILIAGAGAVLIQRDQGKKHERELIALAEEAVSKLYTSPDEKELAYMSNDSLIEIAVKQVSRVTSEEDGILLSRRVTIAREMYKDQVRADDAINALFNEDDVPKEGILQSDMDNAIKHHSRVTNREWSEKLGGKLEIAGAELDARMSAYDAVIAIEEAQKTEWNDTLAIAADDAIALVKNATVRMTLEEKMRAVRAAETEKQTQLAAERVRAEQSNRNARQGGSSRLGTQNPPASPHPSGYDYTWYRCICQRFFATMDQLLFHVQYNGPGGTEPDGRNHAFLHTFQHWDPKSRYY